MEPELLIVPVISTSLEITDCGGVLLSITAFLQVACSI
jgi:hypothetical protein